MLQNNINNLNHLKSLIKYNKIRNIVFYTTLFFMISIFAYSPSINLFIFSAFILYLQYSVLSHYYQIPKTSPLSTGVFVNILLERTNKVVVFSYLLELYNTSNNKLHSEEEHYSYINTINYLKKTHNYKELIKLSKHNLTRNDKFISKIINKRLKELL